jgi:hypothetical protein
VRRDRLAVGLGMAAGALAAPVLADQPTGGWTLEWTAPPVCPDVAYVRQAVGRLLRRASSASGRLSAHAFVTEASGGRWHAEIETSTPAASGRRTLDAGRCEELADATALIVALMIDPSAVMAPAAEAATSAPSSATGSVPDTGMPVAAPATLAPLDEQAPSVGAAPGTAVAEARPRTPEAVVVPKLSAAKPTQPVPSKEAGPFFAAAGVVAGLGALPGVAAGATLQFGARFDRLRIGVGASYWPPESATNPAHPPAGARVDLETGSVATCATLVRTPRVEGGPCLGFEAGRMHAMGTHAVSTAEGAAAWAAASAGGYATVFVLPPVALAAELDVAVPLTIPDFELTHVGTAFEAGRVAGKAMFSTEVRF